MVNVPKRHARSGAQAVRRTVYTPVNVLEWLTIYVNGTEPPPPGVNGAAPAAAGG